MKEKENQKACELDRDKKTILVIEDEKSLQFAIVSKLRREGFNVLEARSVEEALKHLDGKNCIDAVWLDHYLIGKEDGIDFMAGMKNTQYKDVPVFIVSNTVNPNKIRVYIMMGAVKYYTKAEHKLEEIIQDIRQAI